MAISMPPFPGSKMVLIPSRSHEGQVPRVICPLQDLPPPVVATGALPWLQALEFSFTRSWKGQARLLVAEATIRLHNLMDVLVGSSRRVLGLQERQGRCRGP